MSRPLAEAVHVLVDCHKEGGGTDVGKAADAIEAYANSQEVKERHWRELLDAIGRHMLLLDMESIAEHWREVDYSGSDDDGVYGTTYAELYKRLGLAE